MVIIKKHDQKKRPGYREKGFTFIDLIVASTVILFLVLGIAQLILYSVWLKNRTDIRMETAKLAAAKLEELRILPFESMQLKPGESEESSEVPWIKTPFVRIWRVEDHGDSLKGVEVECFIQSDSLRKTRLLLIISRRLGF